jgi:hypothetical protein
VKPEEIDAMEAGRALDALVAERVMGWRWWNRAGAPSMLFAPDIDVAPYAGRIEEPSRLEPLYSYSSVPLYSMDHAPAFGVLARLERDPRTILSGITRRLDIHGTILVWEVVLRSCETIDLWVAAAPALPLAICRTALKAVQG